MDPVTNIRILHWWCTASLAFDPNKCFTKVHWLQCCILASSSTLVQVIQELCSKTIMWDKVQVKMNNVNELYKQVLAIQEWRVLSSTACIVETLEEQAASWVYGSGGYRNKSERWRRRASMLRFLHNRQWYICMALSLQYQSFLYRFDRSKIIDILGSGKIQLLC